MGSGQSVKTVTNKSIQQKYEIIKAFSRTGDQNSDDELSVLFNSPILLWISIHKYVQSNSSAALLPKKFVEIALSEDDLETNTIPLHNYNGCTQIISIKLSVEGLSLDDLSVINKFSSSLSTTAIKFPLIELNASTNNLKDNSLKDIFNSTNQDPSLCFDTQALQRLNLSSNQLSSMLNICSLSAHHLLALDVSFCEDLVIEPNSFVFCPQLRELHMDSCNISSTFHADLTGPARSIFFGLVCLEELSLKENALEDVDSCEGLFYFGFDFFDSTSSQSDSHRHNEKAGQGQVAVPGPSLEQSTTQATGSVPVDKKATQITTPQSSKATSSRAAKAQSKGGAGTSATPPPSSSSSQPSLPSVAAPVETNNESVATASQDTNTAGGSTLSSSSALVDRPPSTLKRLFLRDNPVHSSLSLRRTLKPLLLQRLPSITFLDDEALRPSVAPTSSTNRDINRHLLHRREADDQRTDLAGPLGPGGLDSMEREYLAALKGEKDNTVIS
eukprot:gene32768-42426_t